MVTSFVLGLHVGGQVERSYLKLHVAIARSKKYIYHHWGEPERDPHDEVYGDFFCLSVGTFTFRIYSCSNSTITHAQNLCAIFFSHVVCMCIATCACRSSTIYEVHGLHLRTFNKNKPV